MEMYTPMVHWENLWLIIALATTFDLELHAMDVVAVFLHSPLQEEIYIKQPEGYVDLEHPDWVCCLLKSLYGLKQAPYEWNKSIDAQLCSCGFIPLDADLCVYVLQKSGDLLAIIAIHVDDCMIATHKGLLTHAKASLTDKFQMQDLGEVSSILSMEIIHDQPAGQLYIIMQAYIHKVLSLFNMANCQPVTTPMVVKLKLPKLDSTTESD